MRVGDGWWRRDLLLRAAGIGLALIGHLAIRHLFEVVNAVPRPAATLGEIALAAVGFLGFSLGAALALLGAHIHDRVEVSERWRRRAAERVSDPPARARVAPAGFMADTGA